MGEGDLEGIKTGDETGPAWLAQMPADLKGNEAFTKFETIGDLGKNYLDLQGRASELDELKTKLETAVIKPGENATPEEISAYRSALGVPEKPEEYEFPTTEGLEHSEQMDSWARKIFHDAGLNKDQAAQISQAWDGFIQEMDKAHQELEAKVLQEVETELRKEWTGESYDKNFELSNRAFKKFAGRELSEFKAHPTLIKAFYEIGKAMGEDDIPQGGPPKKSSTTPGMNYDMPDFE